MCITMLCAVVVAAAVRDLRNDAVPFMAGVVRHITMVAVVQQCSKLFVVKLMPHSAYCKLLKSSVYSIAIITPLRHGHCKSCRRRMFNVDISLLDLFAVLIFLTIFNSYCDFS